MEEVKESVKNTDYEVLKYLSQFLLVKDIAKQLKVSNTAIYKRLYSLLEKGMIRKIGKSYELTDEGINKLNSFIKSSNTIRLHNLAFKVRIINKPNNWDLKRSQIVQTRTLSKEIELNNNSYEIHSFSNIKVKTTNNSIIFYMPHYYGKDTDDCFKQALDSLWNTIPKIENLFKIILIKDRKANIEIISQHYAKLQDSLAKIYKIENNKLNVFDEDGNLWLICDFSFKTEELETIYNKTSKEDMDSVKGFLNDLRNNPTTFSQVLDLVNQVAKSQLVASQQMENYAKNIESHIEAIKSLSSGVKKLTKTIGGIIKENNKLKMGNQKTLMEF